MEGKRRQKGREGWCRMLMRGREERREGDTGTRGGGRLRSTAATGGENKRRDGGMEGGEA